MMVRGFFFGLFVSLEVSLMLALHICGLDVHYGCIIESVQFLNIARNDFLNITTTIREIMIRNFIGCLLHIGFTILWTKSFKKSGSWLLNFSCASIENIGSRLFSNEKFGITTGFAAHILIKWVVGNFAGQTC
jgi:hypothetical protein